jgi:O-antigen/teichoic acid export membrane protein
MLKNPIVRLLKGSAIYGVGVILQRFMGLLLLPIFTSVVSPEDYGIVALISLISIALSGLLTLGTGNSMGVLYFREQDLAERPSIIWSNIILMVVNCAFWYVFFFLCAPTLSALIFGSDRFADLIRIAVLGSVFSSISDPLLAYLRMEEKAKFYVIITLISTFFTIGISIWLVLFENMGARGLILSTTLVHGITLLISFMFIGPKLRFSFKMKLFWPLARIGFPSIFGLFAFLIIDYADRQMVEKILGLSSLGVYSIGYGLGMVMLVAVGAFSTAWPPFFMSYINKPKEARDVFSHVLRYYLIGFGVLLVLFFAVAKPIVVVMTAPPFHEAFIVIGLVAASYMLKGCYLIVLPGIYFAEKLYKQSLIEWAAAFVNIGLNILLIPLLGILGAALATFISYLTLPVLAWAAARKHLQINYDWASIGLSLFLTVSASAFLFWTSVYLQENLLLMVFINMITIFTSLIAVILFLLDTTERKSIREALKF